MKLSLVVPCYNEEENIRPFFDTVVSVFADRLSDTELIFVDDGSRDRTKEEMAALCRESSVSIRVVSFSRNFGKEAAILAGLSASKGDYTAIIDGDLQQHPRYVLQMLDFLEENPDYDGVTAYQSKRKESAFLRFFKNSFYRLINRITQIEFHHSASDFRLLNRNMVEAVLSLPEKCRFSKGIFSWIGFRVHTMPYQVEKRHAGKTKWNFWKLSAYAMDGIIAFSDKPLILSSVAGFILFLISVLMMLGTILKTLLFGETVQGYPTLATLILFSSGIQLLFIGLIGQYLSKIYTESKERPSYIVKEEFSNRMK